MVHRIDKHILTQLLTHTSCSFASLRAPGVESNTLTYRLKRMISLGYVTKNSSGRYYLTSEGRFYTDRLNLGKFVSRELPRPLTLLVCRRGDEWLLFRRGVHPLRNLIGFPHANVKPGTRVLEEATRRFSEVMGLHTTFKHRGFAYMTYYRHGQLEAYNQMNIVENCEPITGTLRPRPEEQFGEYFWVKQPDFTQDTYIPSMPVIVEALQKHDDIFFLDQSFEMLPEKEEA